MKTIEEIKRILRQHKPELQERFKVSSIAVYGSYARGDQREGSDVDILVAFREPVGLLFIHLANYLEDLLGLKVDLVTKNGIKPNRRTYVEEDLTYV